MGERVRVERDDAGRLVAAKAADPAWAEALMAEAELLRRAQMPGVVELIEAHPAPVPTLVTRWVGTRTLADLPLPLTPERAGALCLAVASTIESLHRTGVVHGAVEPTHVLLDAGGRPVLCGFGSAGLIGAPVRRPVTDRPEPSPALPGADEVGVTLRPAVDVAGLGRLLAHLVTSLDGPEPLLGRVSAAGRRSGRHVASGRRALLAVAGQATVEDPTCRPSVAALIHSIRMAVPDARLGELPATPPDPSASREGLRGARHLDEVAASTLETHGSRPLYTWVDLVDGLAADTADLGRLNVDRNDLFGGDAFGDGGFEELFADLDRRGRPGAALGHAAARSLRTWVPAAAAVVAIGATTYLGLSAWWSTTSAGTGLATADSISGDLTTGDGQGAQPASGGSEPATETDIVSDSDGVTASGAPRTSPQDTDTGSAPVVDHDGRRYSVGQPADIVAAGPWLCDGRELLLLLRPSTGSVHLFPEWPVPGASLDAPVVATVAGATSLTKAPESSASSCPQVVVGRADGTSIRLPPEDLR